MNDPSSAGTSIPSATQIVDANKSVWTVSAGVVYRDGAKAGFSANEEGVKRANSKKAKELLELIHVVRELDPKRAKELLAKYPEIADAPAPQEPTTEEKKSDADEEPELTMPLIPFQGSMNVAAMSPAKNRQ